MVAKNISIFCNAEERDDDVININNNLLHLPPMMFPYDILELSHNSLHKIQFNVSDALTCWAIKHKNPSTTYENVPFAQTNSLLPNGCSFQQWDWTYSSNYNCTMLFSGLKSVIDSGGSLLHLSNSGVVDTGEQLPVVKGEWIPCRDSNDGYIDMDMLKQKDDILFFDELVLYQVIMNERAN
jgi:hypothetical protein